MSVNRGALSTCDGIGRHACLRSKCPYGCAGSIPAKPTMNLTPQFFLTADTHFGHEKHRLLERSEDFNEVIIENWNSVVGKKERVLHLGDLTFCGKEETIEWCKQLHGKKYLIKGNHDSHTVGWFKDCGFRVVEPIYKIFKDKYDNYNNFLFTHVPAAQMLTGRWFNVHGHMHGRTNSHPEVDFLTRNHYDVGVDCHDFKPIRLYDILASMI